MFEDLKLTLLGTIEMHELHDIIRAAFLKKKDLCSDLFVFVRVLGSHFNFTIFHSDVSCFGKLVEGNSDDVPQQSFVVWIHYFFFDFLRLELTTFLKRFPTSHELGQALHVLLIKLIPINIQGLMALAFVQCIFV